MNYKELEATIASAGIHKTEFAAIASVSRASLHEYIRGRRTPHHLTEKQLLRAARVLSVGVEKGTLPPADTSRKARKKLVVKLKSQLAR
jgi:transcriptional regulator with XRE-family HTH domain